MTKIVFRPQITFTSMVMFKLISMDLPMKLFLTNKKFFSMP